MVINQVFPVQKIPFIQHSKCNPTLQLEVYQVICPLQVVSYEYHTIQISVR